MTIKQENAKIAAELGIPRIILNEQQRGYYEIHFRNCVRYLWWVAAANAALIAIILYLFFKQPLENCYATSFTGDVTPLQTMSLDEASTITQQNKLPQQGDNS